MARGDCAIVSPFFLLIPYYGSMIISLRHMKVLALVLACALALPFGFGGAGGIFGDSFAFADEVADAQQLIDDAQSTLTTAEAHMAAIASDREGLQQDIDALQVRIDESLTQATTAQEAVIEGRAALGKMAAYEYGNGSFSALFDLVFNSTSFTELLQSLSYFTIVMDYQAAELAAQQERAASYDTLVRDLNFQKDEQDKKLVALAAKQAEAALVVSDTSSKLQNAQDDQVVRLAALKKAAEEMAASVGVTEPVIDPGANTIARPDTPDVPVQPNPDPTPPATTPPATTPDPVPGAPEVGWSTGVASAYGGSTDPSTPNPGTTASGAVCDDWSMGVAVPMAWPRYWQYYGRTVEISYGGMTVFATINDCGGMGGGSRSLDLQPGVWKAFGFSSCNDWGLRSVNYRIL